MPVSTNSTIEHTLAKFSNKQRKSDGAQANWVHWASPTLVASLAVSTALDGTVTAAQLAVFWRRDQDVCATRGEITLEELDLLAFSSVPSSPLQAKPLRAVYSGAVVGIRYMHPLNASPSSQSNFNQIQFRFQDASDASQFVAALSRFCACKEETARPTATQTMGPPASTAKRQIALSKAPAVVKRPTMAAAARPARFATPAFEGINMSSSPAPPAASTPTLASSPPAEFPTPAAPTPVQTNHFASHEASQFELAYDSSSHLPMDPVPPAPVVPDRPSSLDHATSAPTLTDTAMDVRPDCTPLQEPHERAQSFPAAVPVTVHSSSLPHRTPTLSDMQTTHDASSAVTPAQSVLAAVREVPALYQLTTPELERAIGEIVREQGFLDFLGRVEGMWRVRGLVGR